MSDILCAVCAEPWDQYGIGHGDMAKWEAVLFRQGAGCPSCEGVAPKREDALEEHLRSVVMESEDPDSFSLLHGSKPPKWERPEDLVVFECAGCDSKIKKNHENEEPYWHSPTVDRYYHHRPGGYDWSTDPGDLFEIGGEKYCPACATTCDDCHEAVFRSDSSCTGTILYGDTYDPGASHPDPRDTHGTICTGCLEAIPSCSECGAILDEDDETDGVGRGTCCAESEDEEDDEEDEESDEDTSEEQP